ncbi:hypothetical protein V5O48_012540 [Marasmius crinis-equi]|uniref:Uncharacterized protein n=1 Tax=Marasmius crinis-equi TaxID=585013 RepID=A0ABR3F2K1_9AGAR
MPAPRIHKSKKARQKADQQKFRAYYERNRNSILAKKRTKYNQHKNSERQVQKAVREERRRSAWEIRAGAEHSSSQDTITHLRQLEKQINEEFQDSGSRYFNRLFHEYLAWAQSNPRPSDSPLETPVKVFNSMVDTVAKIGNAILNEYGTWGMPWKECRRLTMRIRVILQCTDDLEVARIEGDVEGEGADELERRYSGGRLEFQRELTRQWLDRLTVARYVALLDRTDEAPPPPSLGKPLFW